MPLVQGYDSRGRPVYSAEAVAGATPASNGVAPVAAGVDVVEAPVKRESDINYDFLNNRSSGIKQQGETATLRAQDAARVALQARLLRTQATANRSIERANANYGSGQSPAGNVTGTDLRSRLVSTVASQKGVKYTWGGESRKTGFDCSGLVQWAYGQLGISMPRTSGPQAHMGVRTPINKLRPGDLVAHPGHIAVYAGNGMMWEAPHTGAVVRLVPVRRDMYGVHLTLPGD